MEAFVTSALPPAQPGFGRPRSTAFQRQVQVLGYGWRNLTPLEVNRILQLIDPAPVCAGRPETTEELETALAVAASLFTGRSFEDLTKLEVRRLSSWTASAAPIAGLYRCAENWGFLLPPGKPGGGEPEGEGNASAFLWLPCPPIVEPLARRSLTARGLLQAQRAELFASSAERLHVWARKLLGEDTRVRRGATTVESLRHWLFDAITRTSGGDAALAQIVTGKARITSKTSSYYSGCTQAQVEHVWRRAVEPIAGAGLKSTPHGELRERRFGTPYCPSDEQVRLLAGRLRKRYRAAEDPQERHNALTRYTAVLCAVGLALRSSTRPVLMKRGIDPQTGFLVIDDSREASPAKIRLSWAAPAVRKQLMGYAASLESSLDSRIRSLFDGAGSALPFGLFELGSFHSRNLDEILKSVCAEEKVPLKSNFGRHLIRTRLLGRCSTETLQAFFGHWNSGTEPFGRASGLDPIAYRADLARSLPPLLQELGWMAL